MPSDAQINETSTFSGIMESDHGTLQYEADTNTFTSSIPNAETTLIPQLSPRPPEEGCFSNIKSNEISEIKTTQPCVEIDGASQGFSPKKTQQEFFEKIMVNMDDCKETDHKSTILGTDVLRKDSNENIAPELDERKKDSDFSAIASKVQPKLLHLNSYVSRISKFN